MTTTTTTANIDWSTADGANSVTMDATITRTPGYNLDYLRTGPGRLKVLPLGVLVVLAAVALVLVAAQVGKPRPLASAAPVNATDRVCPRDPFILGDLAFLGVQAVVAAVGGLLLRLYLLDATSAILIPDLEPVAHRMLAYLLLAAGALQIVATETGKYGPDNITLMMGWAEEVVRLAAGFIALGNGALCALGYYMAREHRGKTD